MLQGLKFTDGVPASILGGQTLSFSCTLYVNLSGWKLF